MIKPVGVILAGGQSRRMGGGDKALLNLGGQPLLRHVIDRLTPQVSEIALNANGDASRFLVFTQPVIADSIPGYAGPLAGVLAGLDWAAERGAACIVTAAADTPFFPRDLVVGLLAAAQQKQTSLALAASADPHRGMCRHPTFGLWPVSLRHDLRAAIAAGTRKVVEWSDAHGCTSAAFPSDPFDPFFNINTPEDMAQAELFLAKDRT